MHSDISLVKVKSQDQGFPWKELAIFILSSPGNSQLLEQDKDKRDGLSRN